MSLCFKIKLMFRELTSAALNSKKTNSCPQKSHETNITTKEKCLEKQDSLYTELANTTIIITDSDLQNKECFEAHGIRFSSKEDRDGFISKMKEMSRIFEKEILEISRQHQRLRAGGYLLNSRVLEMERIIKTDQRKGSIDSIATPNYDSCYTSEDYQVVQDMDTLYSMLDNAHEEILSLRRYLDIEYKERTLYPEPTMLRSSTIEDEFSKKMKEEGGLNYQSRDNTIKRITYNCLPPPFTLQQVNAL